MADNSVIQEIRERLDVAEVISGYIPTKKAGTNYKASCPFHSEKSASLMISPQKQIWHCFGCGEGGDVFGFVMRYENVEFKEALKILAARAGVALPEYKPRDSAHEQEKDLFLKINAFAAEFYHRILLKDPTAAAAREYLEKRGLKIETIKKWKIGYAPDDFHVLERELLKRGVKQNDLVKAGVSSLGQRGVYDRFRGRITFPIFNYYGEPVGFSARILKADENTAKYINSPETPIYHKSSTLFGLNFAKAAIRKLDEMVMVEGQMDCIAAHQAGFENVVASSGTAYTADARDLTLARRLTRNIKFCFDTDKAGRLAARKAVEFLLGQSFSDGKGFVIKIVQLPGAKDPDELINKDPEAWREAVQNAPLFMDYYMGQIFENFHAGSVEEKKSASEEIVPLLARLTDPVEKDHYIKQAAARLGVSEPALNEAIKKYKVNPAVSSMPMAKRPAPAAKPASPLEKEMLGALIKLPEFADRMVREGSLDDFENPEIRSLVAPFFAMPRGQTDPENALAKEGVFMVESQMKEAEEPAVYQRYLSRSFAQLRLASIKRQQKDLSEKIRQAQESGKTSEAAELSRHFAELSALRVSFEKQI